MPEPTQSAQRPARLRRALKILRICGCVGLALFAPLMGWLYVLGTRIQEDDVTPDTLRGRWTTRLVRYHDRPAVRIYARFALPMDEVWKFVLDYERYPDRIDYIRSCRVLDRSDSEVTLDLVVRSFPTDIHERVRVRYEVADGRRVARWTHEEGQLARNDGEWELQSTPEGTFLKYTLCIAYRRGIPAWLVNALARLNGFVVPDAIERRVEDRWAGRFPG